MDVASQSPNKEDAHPGGDKRPGWGVDVYGRTDQQGRDCWVVVGQLCWRSNKMRFITYQLVRLFEDEMRWPHAT